MNLTAEAIDTIAASKLAEIQKVLWDFEIAECITYIAARDYEAVMKLMNGKINEATRSFATDVMHYDDLCLSRFFFRRRVREARKNYEAVSKAYGSWSVFMTQFRNNAWN